jgi:hypothetical protein
MGAFNTMSVSPGTAAPVALTRPAIPASAEKLEAVKTSALRALRFLREGACREGGTTEDTAAIAEMPEAVTTNNARRVLRFLREGASGDGGSMEETEEHTGLIEDNAG